MATGSLSACNVANGQAIPDFTVNYGCGQVIGVSLGSGWGSDSAAARGAIADAVAAWNAVLAAYNLPQFAVGGGTVVVNATGSGTQYCGSSVPGEPHTVSITRDQTCSNWADAGHLGLLFTHELGHILGFGDWWHKMGDANRDSTAGNCAMWLPQPGGVNVLNGSVCAHELEALYTEFGVSGRPAPDFSRHIVTGVGGIGSVTTTLGRPDTIVLSQVEFALGNAPWIYGTGCEPLAPRMGPMLSAPPSGCTNRLGTVALAWATGDPGIFTVAALDSADAVITPAAVGTANLTLTLSDPANRYNIGSAFFVAGQQIVVPVTVRAPTPAAIAFTAGAGQTAAVHTNVAVNPTVTVTGTGGVVVPGDTVDFTVTVGGGSPAPAFAVTDPSGHASTTWQMGTTAGQQILKAVPRHTVLAAYDTATAVAGAASALSIVAGNNQTAPKGSQLPVAPTVKVADAYGNGVSGVTVTFGTTTPIQNGSVSPTSVATSAAGTAATQWTIGVRLGPDTMTATVSGLTGSPARFLATGTSTSGTMSVSSCRTQTFGVKVYNYFTLSWSGASAGSHSIYENVTNNPGGASVIGSGSGASGSVEVGPYLHQTVPNTRYWWLDDVTPNSPNPYDTANCIQ